MVITPKALEKEKSVRKKIRLISSKNKVGKFGREVYIYIFSIMNKPSDNNAFFFTTLTLKIDTAYSFCWNIA